MKPTKYLLLVLLTACAWAQTPSASSPSASSASASSASAFKEVDSVFADSHALYLDLHQNPELSFHETETAAKLAKQLRGLGYEVTEHVGGTGVVALLKNGAGPVIMLRTELDALPVEEKTGLPYASKVHAKDDAGHDVSVMHACGHDVHMASLVGAAAVMAHSKNTWHGTLMLIGQPAEEAIFGAKRMIEDGLFTRFPKPKYGIALHVANALPAGKVGVVAGTYDANSDALRITLYGKGGHGSAPNTTVDPVVLAAKTILSLQTIVSREVKPGEMAVVTVGYVLAGTKNNIISDHAELGLSLRSFKADVRQQLLAAIPRIVKAEAVAAGSPKEPLIERIGGVDSVYNDPALEQRLREPLESALGKDDVISDEPITASEDYSYFIAQGIPSLYFDLGGANPEKLAAAKAAGEYLPSNHSPFFAPDAEPAIRTGIAAEVAVLRNLLQ